MKISKVTDYAALRYCQKLTLRQRQNVSHIFMGNRWPFKKRVQILGLLWILLGKANFVLLMKAQITRKKIN